MTREQGKFCDHTNGQREENVPLLCHATTHHETFSDQSCPTLLWCYKLPSLFAVVVELVRSFEKTQWRIIKAAYTEVYLSAASTA